MYQIYEKIFANLMPMMFIVAPFPKQLDISKFKESVMQLEPGDVITRKSEFLTLFTSLLKGIGKVPSHVALYIGDGLLFDLSFPRARKLPLQRFLALARDISVIKLKARSVGLKQKLQNYANQRNGAPYTLQSLAAMAYNVILQNEFTYRASEREREEIWKQTKALLNYGSPFHLCVSSILQPWFQFIPQIKAAYLKTEQGRLNNYIPFDPYSFLVFTASHPQLFQLSNPLSQEYMALTSELQEKRKYEEPYRAMTHSRKFLKHTKMLISLSGIASLIRHSPKVNQKMRNKVERLKDLFDKLASGCVEHATSPSSSTSEKLFSLVCALYQSLELGAKPVAKDALILQEIKAELNSGAHLLLNFELQQNQQSQMQNIYKYICCNIYNLVWAYSPKERPKPPTDFSWITPDLLEAGDIILGRLIMPDDFRASEIFQRQILKHGALVVGHDKVFDMQVPYSTIKPLKKFLTSFSHVTVIKLRTRPDYLKEELMKFAQSRSNEEFSIWLPGFAKNYFLKAHYFKTSQKQGLLQQGRFLDSSLADFGHSFYGCTTAIYQAWLKYLPEVRTAFWKFYNKHPIPLFTPDPQLIFIALHPELFQVINPPPKEEIDLIEKMYFTPVPPNEVYNPLHKQKNFIKHARLLIFFAGVVSKLIHNRKVPPGLKSYLRKVKVLLQSGG